MTYRELELTLLSARDLKSVNLFNRMEVYAVVTISGDPLTRQCTPTDPYGGRNPSWNATLRFAIPPTAAAAGGRWLHVLLRSERVLGDRDVGEVIVPLADLLAGAATPGPQPPHLASYQVRRVHRGEPRGVLNVSYRLGPIVAPVEVERPPERAPVKPPSVIAYPAPPPPQQFYYPPADAYQVLPPPPRAAIKITDAEHEAATPPRKENSNGLGPMGHTQVLPPSKEEGKSNGLGPMNHTQVSSPKNGSGNGYSPMDHTQVSSPKKRGYGPMGPTQVCVGPHTQIFLGAPARSNSGLAKADASRPKPLLQNDPQIGAYSSPVQSNNHNHPVKTDHSKYEASVQHDKRINQRPVAASSESAISPHAFSHPP